MSDESKSRGVRLPDDLLQAVRELAASESRSFSNMVVVLMREAVRARQARAGAAA